MAINPDLFRCDVCGERPAEYTYFQATDSGRSFETEYRARAAQPGWTGPQPSIGHPDSLCLCSRHRALADEHCKDRTATQALSWLVASERSQEENAYLILQVSVDRVCDYLEAKGLFASGDEHAHDHLEEGGFTRSDALPGVTGHSGYSTEEAGSALRLVFLVLLGPVVIVVARFLIFGLIYSTSGDEVLGIAVGNFFAMIAGIGLLLLIARRLVFGTYWSASTMQVLPVRRPILHGALRPAIATAIERIVEEQLEVLDLSLDRPALLRVAGDCKHDLLAEESEHTEIRRASALRLLALWLER